MQLALNSEASVLKIGADLDVNPKTIYNWIKIYKHKNNIFTDDRFKTRKSTIKNSESQELKLFVSLPLNHTNLNGIIHL